MFSRWMMDFLYIAASGQVKKDCRGDAILCRYADDFVSAFQLREDAERFYRALPKRLDKFGLEVAPEKTQIIRFSRFHPSMKHRFTFLGFELYWFLDHNGEKRVMRRTARNKLRGACRRIKEWIKANRHLKGREFIKALNRRLRGHYNYYGLRGNLRSLNRFYRWAIGCSFKWLNRRGGKRTSFTWSIFNRALERLGVAVPYFFERKRVSGFKPASQPEANCISPITIFPCFVNPTLPEQV